MAQSTEQKRSNVDAPIERWRGECLVEDGPLLFSESRESVGPATRNRLDYLMFAYALHQQP